MKIIEIAGGLGNQMFQYAFGKALTLENNEELKLDTSFYIKNYGHHNGFELKKLFNITDEIVSKKDLYKLKGFFTKYLLYFNLPLNLPKTYYREENYPTQTKKEFDFFFKRFNAKKIPLKIKKNSLLKTKKDLHLSGTFFSQEYFKKYDSEIKNFFIFKNLNLNQKNSFFLKRIKNSNSISLHIRRGDYVNTSASKGICGFDYYEKAIGIICLKIKNPTIFIFSDDIDWVKINFKTNFKTFYISGNIKGLNYIDMYLMSNCKHNICANSSFSWWGAYLNNNKSKIVIVPKKFSNFYDPIQKLRYPKNWIRI